MSTLFRRAAQSSAWLMIAQAVQMGCGFVSFIVLSRWLGPEEYGAAALSATVSGLLGIVGDAGVTSSLIRTEGDDASTQATGFWLAVLGGGALSLVAALAAPGLGWYFGSSRVGWLALAQSLAFLVAAPMRVPAALLARELRFRELAIAGVASTGAGILMGWGVAAAGGGAWALVMQTLGTFAVQDALLIRMHPYCVRWNFFSKSTGRTLMSFSSQMGGFQLGLAASRTGDVVLGGRLLGPEPIGLVGLATKLLVVPGQRLAWAISAVLLPAILKVEPARRGAAFASTVRISTIAVAPIAFGAFVAAAEIAACFPARWAGLAPVLRAMSLGVLVEPLVWLAIAVLTAEGRSTTLLRIVAVVVPVGWAASLAGSLLGLPATLAGAWAFTNLVTAAGLLLAVSRSLSVGGELVRAAGTPLCCAAIAAMAGWLALVASGLSGTRIGLGVAASATCSAYAALLLLCMRSDVVRIVGAFRGRVAADVIHTS